MDNCRKLWSQNKVNTLSLFICKCSYFVICKGKLVPVFYFFFQPMPTCGLNSNLPMWVMGKVQNEQGGREGGWKKIARSVRIVEFFSQTSDLFAKFWSELLLWIVKKKHNNNATWPHVHVISEVLERCRPIICSAKPDASESRIFHSIHISMLRAHIHVWVNEGGQY